MGAAEERSAGDLPDHHDAYAIARQVLNEGSLTFTRAAAARSARTRDITRGASPTFPPDWSVGLIDVVQAAARVPHGAGARTLVALTLLAADAK